MPIILDGTAGIDNNATDLSYTGTLTGGTGVVNLGSGQVVKDASGNVGIGTTTSLKTLTTQGTGVALVGSNNSIGNELFFYRQGGSLQGYIGWEAPSNPNSAWTFDSSNGNPIRWAIDSIERMRIDSSGNLLVGTTSVDPGIGNTNTGAQVSPGAFIASRTSATSLFLNRNTSDGATAEFRRQGNQVGSISVTTSATSYVTSSDYRLKHDIAPMTGALAKVALLKPCTYKWNVDDSADEGFIAHELAEVCPAAVTGEKDAVETYTDEDGNEATRPVYQGIDTSFLVATLTAAIQELKAINDAQAQTIESLTARVVALEQA